MFLALLASIALFAMPATSKAGRPADGCAAMMARPAHSDCDHSAPQQFCLMACGAVLPSVNRPATPVDAGRALRFNTVIALEAGVEPDPRYPPPR